LQAEKLSPGGVYDDLVKLAEGKNSRNEGTSGNARPIISGQVRAAIPAIRRAGARLRYCRIKSLEMAKVLTACAEDPEAPWAARIQAAGMIMDRRLGKVAAQNQLWQLDGESSPGVIRIEFVSASGERLEPDPEVISTARAWEGAGQASED